HRAARGLGPAAANRGVPVLRRGRWLGVGLALALAAACSGPGIPGARSAASPKASAPPPTAPPASAPPPASPPAPAPSCGDATASLRPPSGVLPTPGSMPSNTFMKTIQERGKLVAGVSQDILLFGYQNPITNQLEGFDIDMIKQVAKAIFGDESRVE